MNLVYYIHDVASSEEFEQTLLFLRHHYRFISPDELRKFLDGQISLNNTCLLTIDDGCLSSYQYIYPVLRDQKIPAILFVSPDVCQKKQDYWFYLLRFCDESDVKKKLIDNRLYDSGIVDYPLDLLLKGLPADTVSKLISDCLADRPQSIPRGFINTQELMEMHDSGLVEIGAHTLSHPILSLESDERAKKEITESVRRLSELLGAPVRSFAYPNGIPGMDFGKREMQFVKETGVDLAFSVESNTVRHATERLAIPRIGSINRLKLGYLGVRLPSLSNQAGTRKRIARHLL